MSTTTWLSFDIAGGVRCTEAVVPEPGCGDRLVLHVQPGSRLASVRPGDELHDVVLETVTVVSKPSRPTAHSHSEPTHLARLRVVEVEDPGPPQRPRITLLIVDAACRVPGGGEGR